VTSYKGPLKVVERMEKGSAEKKVQVGSSLDEAYVQAIAEGFRSEVVSLQTAREKLLFFNRVMEEIVRNE